MNETASLNGNRWSGPPLMRLKGCPCNVKSMVTSVPSGILRESPTVLSGNTEV
ncbi:hypothetical protein D3C74_469210 [compost metagenome]